VTATYEIEPFDGSHHRAAFNCGVTSLNDYLATRVTQDIKRRMSNCFVAIDAERNIVGYYTLASSSVPLQDISEQQAKKLPKYPVVPSALIGRLAIDLRHKGKGLGSALVYDAALRASKSSAATHCLIVDAKDEAALAFYQHLGFIPFKSKTMSLYLPLATILT
jgi:ribosomal protein S18 acetylase RimI-like enzyme